MAHAQTRLSGGQKPHNADRFGGNFVFHTARPAVGCCSPLLPWRHGCVTLKVPSAWPLCEKHRKGLNRTKTPVCQPPALHKAASPVPGDYCLSAVQEAGDVSRTGTNAAQNSKRKPPEQSTEGMKKCLLSILKCLTLSKEMIRYPEVCTRLSALTEASGEF